MYSVQTACLFMSSACPVFLVSLNQEMIAVKMSWLPQILWVSQQKSLRQCHHFNACWNHMSRILLYMEGAISSPISLLEISFPILLQQIQPARRIWCTRLLYPSVFCIFAYNEYVWKGIITNIYLNILMVHFSILSYQYHEFLQCLFL